MLKRKTCQEHFPLSQLTHSSLTAKHPGGGIPTPTLSAKLSVLSMSITRLPRVYKGTSASSVYCLLVCILTIGIECLSAR